MNRAGHRLRLAAAAAAVAGLTLTGCGSQDASSHGRAASMHELTAANFGTSLSDAQKAGRSLHMKGTMTVPGSSGTTLTMEGDASMGSSVDDLAMAVTLRGGPLKSMSMRFVDRTFYLKAPGTPLSPDPAKPWVSVSLDDSSNPMAAMIDQVLSNLDPDHMAKLYSAVTKLDDRGVEQVDGIQTRHYAVTMDTEKMVKALGMDKVPGVSLDTLMAQMPASVTSQVWLDDQQRPVKMESDVNGAHTEFHYSRWGEPVHVTAPPASQVRDAADVLH